MKLYNDYLKNREKFLNLIYEEQCEFIKSIKSYVYEYMKFKCGLDDAEIYELLSELKDKTKQDLIFNSGEEGIIEINRIDNAFLFSKTERLKL